MRLVRRLLRFLRPHWGRLAIAMLAGLGAAALDGYTFALLIPFLNALFGEPLTVPQGGGWVGAILRSTFGGTLLPEDPMRTLVIVMGLILAAVAVKNFFAWIAGTTNAQLQERVVRDMRDAAYAHTTRLPLRSFTGTRTGQLISRVLGDSEQAKQLVTGLVMQVVQNGALVLVYIALLASISARLTLIALVAAPLTALALQPLLSRLRAGYRRLRDQHATMLSSLQETVSGIRVVKSFGAEGHEEKRFAAASATYAGGMARMARLAFTTQPIAETLAAVVTVALLWVGARMVLVEGALTAAQLLVFLTVVTRLLPQLRGLAQLPTAAQGALASAERYFELVDTPTERERDTGTIAVSDFRDAITFEGVSFAYDDEPVLRDVSFTVRRGEIVALVGPSGAGKSTLVDLIPRFHDPTAGRILLDGVDTREITLASLRALTAVVAQETILFHDTIRANIAYARADDVTLAEVEAAARAANAHEFVAALPRGYDTVVGERGTRFSGGERQRIAIARALLADPPILILDEATSALDSESERLVREAIERLLAGRTVFVIAHRFSTVAHADRILVLDEGRIVESGTQTELLARRGVYHRLHALQFGAPDAEPALL